MKTRILPIALAFALALTGLQCTRKASQTASVSAAANSTTATDGTSSDSVQPTTSTTGSGNTTNASPTSEYPAYVGRYKMESPEVPYLNVVLEDNKLYGYPDDQPKTEIKYESKDRFNFQTPDISGTVTFSRDGQQQVNGLTVMVNGNELKGEKVKQ